MWFTLTGTGLALRAGNTRFRSQLIMMQEGLSDEDYTYAAKYIMGHEGHSIAEQVSATRYIRQHPDRFSTVEYAYAEQQVMEHPENYTGEEYVSTLKFIIHHPKNYSPAIFQDAAQKMIEHHDQYNDSIGKGLLSATAPHFGDNDLQQAAQLFILKKPAFFTASPEAVKQFFLFAKTAGPVDQSGIVNDYRDSLFKLLCTLTIEEKAMDLWKAGKFVDAPALNVEISLFILRNLNHKVIALWDTFVRSKTSPSPSSIPNLY